jgi:hypothetical protein
MNGLINEIAGLSRSLWNDRVFVKLVAAVAGAGAMALVVGADWEVVFGLVGLGCLAAMLEVTSRDRK